MFLTSSGVANRSLLRTKSIPRRVLALGLLLVPRASVFSAVFWRALLDHMVARCILALSPFIIALIIWPGLALPIASAPLLMLMAIWLFESRILSIASPEARRALIGVDEAGRVIDRLRLASEALLSRIGAARGFHDGRLWLVVEQSGLARMPPLTVVSVLYETDGIEMLDLDPELEAEMRRVLFPGPTDEADLLRANLAENTQIRQFSIDPRGISAHARLAALAAQKRPA
ncbi:MAG: hypothetical protein AAFW64_01910 [Pseudomonadota bacterium]